MYVNQRYVGREPEPEWMEFGPTDRFDVIELKGFDDHEIEREGMHVCVMNVTSTSVQISIIINPLLQLVKTQISLLTSLKMPTNTIYPQKTKESKFPRRIGTIHLVVTRRTLSVILMKRTRW